MSAHPSADLWEIAVYRLTWDAWADDSRRRIDRRIEASLSGYQRSPTDSDLRHEAMLARAIEQPYAWQYNEIVGWVRLRWDGPGPVVKGYLFPVATWGPGGLREKRHFRRGFKAFPFDYGDPTWKVLEEWFDASDSDADIYERLRDALLAITAEDRYLRRRHVDLRTFDAVAPHVRWRELIRLA